jgi:hypothetical protein
MTMYNNKELNESEHNEAYLKEKTHTQTNLQYGFYIQPI